MDTATFESKRQNQQTQSTVGMSSVHQ